MPDTEHMIFMMEMIGTVAFAVSGGMVAIRKHLDLLGILVLGVTTACGGGLIRDLVIGIQPPIMFLKSVYVTAAVISDLLLFAIVKCFRSSMEFLSSKFYERTLNLMDAIGLGVFTVVGVNAAIRLNLDSYVFLKIFLGVITGVGGGIIRDMMVIQVPAVLRKHVYACASIAGAVCYVLLYDAITAGPAMILSTLLVIAIRLLARHYEWNLPKAI